MGEGLALPRAQVALRRWTDFAQAGEVLERCLADLGGMERFVRPGQSVVVKPNLTANYPAEWGSTTHVALVEALVRLLQRHGAGRIVVAEGTGVFGTSLETAFPSGGWREMAMRTGAELYNLDGGPHIEVELANPRYPHPPLPFSQLVREADVFISLPCLKTHIDTDYTVALKNSFALTPQWMRSEAHRRELLEQVLVDLNRIRRPDLTVVDGWHGMEGMAGGSPLGRPAGMRLLLVGADPVAVDTVARDLMGIASRTRYYNWAIEEGVGIGDPARIDVLGERVAALRHVYQTPLEHVAELMPQVTICDRSACSGCRAAALLSVQRFAAQKQFRPVTLVFGGEGDVGEAAGEVLLIGNCAGRYAHRGTHIPGCPPRRDEIVEALRRSKRVCQACAELAGGGILQGYPAEFLAHLRVAAVGSTVHGEEVDRRRWHLELIVGDCMGRYAKTVRERAGSLGMDPARDVAWLEECPPDEAVLRAALDRLLERYREVA